jgi:hypothetical protein
MQSIAVFPCCQLVLLANYARLIIYLALRAFENKLNAALKKGL